jgi:hypothetical protein
MDFHELFAVDLVKSEVAVLLIEVDLPVVAHFVFYKTVLLGGG